jgi:APA family basic amino acid/polyamine antiporter
VTAGREEGEGGARLGRRLGLAETTAAVALGAMIGAGVYVAMGEAAGTTGGSLVLAVVVAAGVATLNGLSSAELAADDPRAGGAYQFARRLVRPAVGFLAGWLFLFGGLAVSATLALTFAAYLEPLLPGVPPRPVGLAFVLAAAVLNWLGVRASARATLVLAAANGTDLLVFAGFTLPALDPSRFEPFLAGGVGGLLRASALVFFAYTGYARPVTIAEEVREPRATLPRAVTAALAATTVVYLAVVVAALGALGPARMGEEAAPPRAAAAAGGLPAGPLLLSLGALAATSTVLLTEVWGLSRLAFAMGRAGDLPAWLGRLPGPSDVPRNAVLAAGALLLAVTALLSLRPALEAASLALLAYYWVMNLSALRLATNRRLYPAGVPAAGLVANPLVALSLPRQTLLIVLGVAAVGSAYYGLARGSGPGAPRTDERSGGTV